MDEITADFLVEARELADRLGEELVALEQRPSDPELLNAAFRAFHTIKGGAGFLDLPPLVEACHAVEEAFGIVRCGKRVADAELFDGAQSTLDHVQAMLDALAAGRPLPRAPHSLVASMLAWAGATGAGAAAMNAAAAAPTGATVAEDAIAAFSSGEGDITDDEFEALLDQLQGGPAATGAFVPDSPAAPRSRDAATASATPAADAEPAEQTLRIEARRLDAIVNLVGELVLARNRLKTLREERRDENLSRAVAALDAITSRLQAAVMKTRMQPIGRAFSRFPKLARDVARQLDKQVDLKVQGAESELDRTLVDALADPLVHLVRNAIDHGIETPEVRLAAGKPAQGEVILAARQEGDHIAIEISDDGAGISADTLRAKAIEKGLLSAEATARMGTDEALQIIFLPGFSTKAEVSDISGRGVGMDVVQQRIRELNGRVSIQSTPGKGSRFLIRLPLTLAILPALMTGSGERVFALPLAVVQEVIPYHPGAVRFIDGREVLDQRNAPVPLVFMREWLGDGARRDSGHVVLLNTADGRIGLVVDQVNGREEVVIKPLPRSLRGLSGHAGATLTGDGRLAVILDTDAIARRE